MGEHGAQSVPLRLRSSTSQLTSGLGRAVGLGDVGKRGQQAEDVRDEGIWCVRCLGTGSMGVGMEVGVAQGP